MNKTYDSECYYLAESFLRDNPSIDCSRRRTELALLIQETVDDYITIEAARVEESKK